MSERVIERMGADEFLEWHSEVVEGLESAVAMSARGLNIPLKTLYAGLEFPQRFRLVRCE